MEYIYNEKEVGNNDFKLQFNKDQLAGAIIKTNFHSAFEIQTVSNDNVII